MFNHCNMCVYYTILILWHRSGCLSTCFKVRVGENFASLVLRDKFYIHVQLAVLWMDFSQLTTMRLHPKLAACQTVSTLMYDHSHIYHLSCDSFFHLVLWKLLADTSSVSVASSSSAVDTPTSSVRWGQDNISTTTIRIYNDSECRAKTKLSKCVGKGIGLVQYKALSYTT